MLETSLVCELSLQEGVTRLWFPGDVPVPSSLCAGKAGKQWSGTFLSLPSAHRRFLLLVTVVAPALHKAVPGTAGRARLVETPPGTDGQRPLLISHSEAVVHGCLCRQGAIFSTSD